MPSCPCRKGAPIGGHDPSCGLYVTLTPATAAAAAIDRAALATDQAMRASFETWMIETAKIIIGSQDPYPAGLERDFWRVWQAAWRAGREAESRKNSRSESDRYLNPFKTKRFLTDG